MSNNIFKSCYKCADRQVGCHANCEKYQTECKQNEEHKKKKRKTVRCLTSITNGSTRAKKTHKGRFALRSVNTSRRTEKSIVERNKRLRTKNLFEVRS